MKTKLFSYLIAGAALSFAACQGTGDGTDRTDDTTGAIESSPDNTRTDDNTDTASMSGTTTLDNNTRDFVVEASGGGMMEVELGQLAQQKATNARVKQFGAMMVRDHTKANNDLKSAVEGKITLPATLPDKHQRHINDLRDETGAEFDRDYMKMMVDDHEADVRKFEKMATDAKDPAVREFAKQTLPTLRAHLDSARAIRNDLSKMNNR